MQIDELRNGFIIGEYTVYPHRAQLVSVHGIENVEPKVMEALVLMASRAAQIITRREFLELLWPNSVVGDESLTRCISILRKALRDSPRSPEYVRTAPRVGYEMLRHPTPVENKRDALTIASPVPLVREPSSIERALMKLRDSAAVKVASAAAVSAWLTLQLIDLGLTISELPLSITLQIGLLTVAVIPSLTAVVWLARAAKSTESGGSSLLRLPTVLVLAASLGWLATGLVASQNLWADDDWQASNAAKEVAPKTINPESAVRSSDNRNSVDSCKQAAADILTASED